MAYNKTRGLAMFQRRQFLYWAEVVAAVVSACLTLLTAFDPQWIEHYFDASPDDGDGSLERWVLIACFSAATVLAAALARREKRRLIATEPAH